MFTKEQIEAAHVKVKSGVDYPRYVEELKDMGIKSYEVVLRDGTWIFKGTEGQSVSFKRGLESVAISEQASPTRFKEILASHQRGETDYITFCIQSGEAGVEKWITDLDHMTVTYLDIAGAAMTVEPIPRL